ncbi:MAG: gliding motility-associated C-terminal domain-containing protein [Bacteroidales bacterium]|jgi:gliding motility-associated-like protein|nr:gliding motility-associated C-terminal domain-containing protein [Bacteroidales bacterium]
MNKKLKNIICLSATIFMCLNLQAQIFDADTLHFCRQDSVMLDAGAGYDSYYWNTGETTQSIWARRTAWYFVEATSSSTSVLDSILIDLNRSRIEQGDTIACYAADLVLSVSNTEPNSLIGDYRFDVGDYKVSNNSYIDYSDYGNNLLCFASRMKSTEDRFGVEDMAVYFSPTTTDPASLSCMYIQYNDTFNISNSFTLHCWVKPDTIFGIRATDDIFYLINRWNPNNLSESSYSLGLSVDGHVHFQSSNGSTSQKFSTSGDTLVYPGRWTMVDIVCSMRKLKIYVNAELKVNEDITALPQSLVNVPTYLGASSGLQNGNYQGGMDDVKIYSSDLSIQEIKNLYNVNTTYAYNYLWNTGETTREITVNPTEESDYHVTVSNNLGYCSDTVHVEVYPEFTVTITQMRKGCPDTSEGILLVNASGGIQFGYESLLPYTYIWPDGYLSNDSILYRLPADDYEISVVDSVGCKLTNIAKVETYPRLNIEIVANPEQIYPQNPVVHFSTETSCDTCYVFDYLWKIYDEKAENFTELKDIEVDYNFGPIGDSTTQFIVQHYQTYEANCVDSATLIIPVARPKLKIPNVFSPNSDGINDTFDITIEGDEERSILDIFLGNTLVIYNRQGKLVYSKNDYPGSPGEFDGRNLSDGVYFYVLKCKGLKKDEVYEGYVHIFRNARKEKD